MIFHTRYAGRSGIINGTTQSDVRFATNQLRETTFFEGTLRKPLAFREALAALYDLVVSDFKYRPRDRFEFQAWLAEQDRRFLATLGLKSEAVRRRMEELEAAKAVLDDARQVRLRPFHRALRAFFEHVYHNEYELQMLLDPVITVHPDQVSFEAFSRDESTYARLAAGYELFEGIGSFECGTTNIDFSLKLHNELERMRTYRRTRFTIDPAGFSVLDGDTSAVVHEKKIDLPDSWLAGFLQVHAVMSMGLTRVRLSPVDLHNLCRFLRRRRAKQSPRAVRWELEPGKRGRVVLEPWEHAIELSHVYDGPKPESIRTWGRDRLRTLSRLVPICDRVDVFLAGFGMPSFYVLQLGPIEFTLGLSGWTDNDWTGGASFELLTRRASLSGEDLFRAYQSLRERRVASEIELAAALGVRSDRLQPVKGPAEAGHYEPGPDDVEKCRSAASFLCQAGRAMVDLASGALRHRDLFQSPFTLKDAVRTIQKAADDANPAAKAARAIVEVGNARLIARRPVKTGWKLSGSVKGTEQKRVRPLLHVDHEGRIIEATCTCRTFHKQQLTKGPCEHMLALRLIHMARLEVDQPAGASPRFGD